MTTNTEVQHGGELPQEDLAKALADLRWWRERAEDLDRQLGAARQVAVDAVAPRAATAPPATARQVDDLRNQVAYIAAYSVNDMASWSSDRLLSWAGAVIARASRALAAPGAGAGASVPDGGPEVIGYVAVDEIRKLKDPGNSRMVAIWPAPSAPDVSVALFTQPAGAPQPMNVLESAAQICDHQADGTKGTYRRACLDCANAVRSLRDAAARRAT